MKKFNYIKCASVLVMLILSPILAKAQTNESGWISLGDFLKDKIHNNEKEYYYTSPYQDSLVLSIKKIAYRPSQKKVNDGKSLLKIYLPYKMNLVTVTSWGKKIYKKELCNIELYVDGKFQIEGEMIKKIEPKQIPTNPEGWKVVDLIELGKNNEKDRASYIKCAKIGSLDLKKGLESDILKNIYVLPSDVSYEEVIEELYSEAFEEKYYVQPKDPLNLTNNTYWDNYLQEKINEAKAKYPDITEGEIRAIKNMVENEKYEYLNKKGPAVKYTMESNGDFSSNVNGKTVGALRRTTPEGIIEEAMGLNFSLTFPNGDKLVLAPKKFDINDLETIKIQDPESGEEKIAFSPLLRLSQEKDSNGCYSLNKNSKFYYYKSKFYYYKNGENKPDTLNYHYGNDRGFLYNPTNYECFNIAIAKDGLKREGILIKDFYYKDRKLFLPLQNKVKEYREIGNKGTYILENGDFIGENEGKVTFPDGTIVTYDHDGYTIKFANGDSFNNKTDYAKIKNRYFSPSPDGLKDYNELYYEGVSQEIEELIKKKIRAKNQPTQYVIPMISYVFDYGIYKTKDGKEYLVDSQVYYESREQQERAERDLKSNNKRQELIRKYGKDMVESCYARKLKIGMPIELVKACWPVSITYENERYIGYKGLIGGYLSEHSFVQNFRVNKKTGKIDKLSY